MYETIDRIQDILSIPIAIYIVWMLGRIHNRLDASLEKEVGRKGK